ncbi:MAG TPA: PHP domain-containing protein [Clostridia bacterium]|nr:PHP domain-containing protein [Clostridia bacterium]
MYERIEKLQHELNSKDVITRLDSLRQLVEMINEGVIKKPVTGNDVNNHIHTTYSFSPYSPAKAVWMACNAGLATAGIMDHDSIGGGLEFIEAGRIAGIATTIGVECRADFSATPLQGRRINNPDQDSVAYVAIHGIPHNKIPMVRDFFAPFTEYRNKRNRKMVDRLNRVIRTSGIKLDFHKDIVPLSMYSFGGSITERHILFGLSLKLIEKLGKGGELLGFLKDNLGLNISDKQEKLLADKDNPYYEYDFLGLLKSELVAAFYIDAGAECPGIKEVISFTRQIGAVSAYAYLGDVGESVTGDKKAQKFEDEYIELLFDTIKELGFNAVTYMPSRNSAAQLERLRSLCRSYGFFQISGEDINSPRQSFICEAMKGEAFSNLIDSTWALIGHEQEASRCIDAGMFSPSSLKKHPELEDRIKAFKEIGLRHMKK